MIMHALTNFFFRHFDKKHLASAYDTDGNIDYKSDSFVNDAENEEFQKKSYIKRCSKFMCFNQSFSHFM